MCIFKMHILVLRLSFKGQLEKQTAVTLDILLRAGADLQPLAVNASYVATLALSLAPQDTERNRTYNSYCF